MISYLMSEYCDASSGGINAEDRKLYEEVETQNPQWVDIVLSGDWTRECRLPSRAVFSPQVKGAYAEFVNEENSSRSLTLGLEKELSFFASKEAELQHRYPTKSYVAIHGNEVLAVGENPGEVIKQIIEVTSDNPPRPLLIRQLLGQARKPLQLRSPRIAKSRTR